MEQIKQEVNRVVRKYFTDNFNGANVLPEMILNGLVDAIVKDYDGISRLVQKMRDFEDIDRVCKNMNITLSKIEKERAYCNYRYKKDRDSYGSGQYLYSIVNNILKRRNM